MALDKDAIDKDISLYVNARLGSDPRFTSKRTPQDLIGQICLKVGNGADGVFRWATCQLDNLATCDSPRSIKEALNDLPRDLNETYRRILQDMRPELKQKGFQLLRFLVYADKPLTVAEAKDVLATHIETVPHHFDIERRLFVDEDLLRYCPGLIMITTSSYVDWRFKGYPSKRTVEREQKEVHLAHFSVKEYLLREHEFQIMTASVQMAQRPSLFSAAVAGDKKTVELLLLEGANPNTHENRDGVLCYVLASAAYAGNQEIVQILLDNGADVNAVDGSGETAVYKAVLGQHGEVARILLGRGADIGIGASSIEYCIKHQLADMKQIIVERAPHADTGWVIC
ncbi:Potassium channel AKT1 [Colletotrichum fructicola]|nr:Potassium channel AKT1 [Colletotrichum fructicola]